MTKEKNELLELRAQLLGSFLTFTQTFYEIRLGKQFTLSEPNSRESHYISIARELTKLFNLETELLVINIPPRYGKTELIIQFVAWALAHNPDSNFLYVSYSKTLAEKQTSTIRNILSLPHYKKIFDVHISDTTSAKGNFETTQNGSVYAAGEDGTITGRGAGIKGVLDRFTGCIIIDDIHKPDEATSDVVREGTINWYYNTLLSRRNSPKVPIIYIGQRVHESDLAAHLLKYENCKKLVLPAIDAAGHALDPSMHTIEDLHRLQKYDEYVFSAQYQQNPQPAGGGIFKEEDFFLTDHEPILISTFITCDTAETDKDWNDATVFSHWGLYRVTNSAVPTDTYGLHWINCRELRIEPKRLYDEFMDFYVQCCRNPVKPSLVAIEKKSTGVTLLSVLKDMRGIKLIDINRTAASGNKTKRFLEIQNPIASKLVSLPRLGAHTVLCIDHCKKITNNNSHAHDDIADTLYDAVKIALIDRHPLLYSSERDSSSSIVAELAANVRRIQQAKRRDIWQR